MRGLLVATGLCLLVSALCGCDKADSLYSQGMRDEQFKFMEGAIDKYMEVVRSYPGTESARLSSERIYAILKDRTKGFTSVDRKSREILDFFASTDPDGQLGTAARQIIEKDRLRDDILSRYTKLFEQFVIEDYTGLEAYFPNGKVDEDLVERLSRRYHRSGLVIQGYRVIDVYAQDQGKAGLVVSRIEYIPENGTTGDVRYQLNLMNSPSGWVISSLGPAPAQYVKSK